MNSSIQDCFSWCCYEWPQQFYIRSHSFGFVDSVQVVVLDVCCTHNIEEALVYFKPLPKPSNISLVHCKEIWSRPVEISSADKQVSCIDSA